MLLRTKIFEPLFRLPALPKSSAEGGQPWEFPVRVTSPSSHSARFFCFAVVAELESCAKDIDAASGKQGSEEE